MTKVLSFDGGGVRGLISATILDNLKIDYDVIAGTSTGAIMAGLLATGRSSKDIIRFYTGSEAEKIFKPYLLPFFHDAKFDEKNINAVLFDIFGDTKLGDVGTKLIIPAYDLIIRNTIVFSNLNINHKDLFLRDVVRASSAAPYYFTPHEFNGFRCVDGGVSANNPAMLAYSYLKNLNQTDNIEITSIGTGSFEKEISKKDMCISSTIPFVSNILDCFMDGNADTVELEAREVLKDKYIRFQTALPEKLSDIDNVKSDNLQALQDLALSYIKKLPTLQNN